MSIPRRRVRLQNALLLSWSLGWKLGGTDASEDVTRKWVSFLKRLFSQVGDPVHENDSSRECPSRDRSHLGLGVGLVESMSVDVKKQVVAPLCNISSIVPRTVACHELCCVYVHVSCFTGAD